MSFRPPDLSHVPLPVVLEDERFVVIDKPSGLLSVPAKDPTIKDNVRARIAAQYPHASGPISVHRLDMETSGLMILALDPQAHRDLSIQFQDRVVSKTYIARLTGLVLESEGVINLPLRVDIENRPLQMVDHQFGKASMTVWKRLAHEQGTTRLQLEPKTGRTHQLRVHCAHPEGLSHPILGDRLYGSESSAPRLMLHARMLSFEHPTTYKRVTVEVPEPF